MFNVNTKVRDFYDKYAKSYDAVCSCSKFLAEDSILKEEIHKTVTGIYHSHIFDVGCGTGYLIGLLGIDSTRYFGIDFSEGMIRIARQKYPIHRFLVNSIEEYFTHARDCLINGSVILSTFGAFSYVENPHLLLTGIEFKGAYIMIYKEDYNPEEMAVQQKENGDSTFIPHLRHSKKDLLKIADAIKGELTEFNDAHWVIKK